jgi:hypothetical protein
VVAMKSTIRRCRALSGPVSGASDESMGAMSVPPSSLGGR